MSEADHPLNFDEQRFEHEKNIRTKRSTDVAFSVLYLVLLLAATLLTIIAFAWFILNETKRGTESGIGKGNYIGAMIAVALGRFLAISIQLGMWVSTIVAKPNRLKWAVATVRTFIRDQLHDLLVLCVLSHDSAEHT